MDMAVKLVLLHCFRLPQTGGEADASEVVTLCQLCL